MTVIMIIAIELEKQLQIKINYRVTLNCVIIHTQKKIEKHYGLKTYS